MTHPRIQATSRRLVLDQVLGLPNGQRAAVFWRVPLLRLLSANRHRPLRLRFATPPALSMADAAAPEIPEPTADSATDVEANTQRRDELIGYEEPVRKLWAEHKVYEANAPAEGEEARPKFMCTFPYPCVQYDCRSWPLNPVWSGTGWCCTGRSRASHLRA
jgi:hypothetical protein